MAPPLRATRIGDVSEEIGESAHLFGGEHHPWRSYTIAGVEYRTGKLGASIGLQWANEDDFGRRRVGAVAFSGPAKALGQPQRRPVRGPIDGPLEARWIDKGLQQ